MKQYNCVSRFFETSLKKYIPAGAQIYKWENVSKITIDYGHGIDPVEYDEPWEVEWVDAVVEKTKWLVLVDEVKEEEGGYIGAGDEDLSGIQGPVGPQGFIGFQGFQGPQVIQEVFDEYISSGQSKVVDVSSNDVSSWTFKVLSIDGLESMKVGALNDSVNSIVYYNINERLGHKHNIDVVVSDYLELTITNNTGNTIQAVGKNEGI